MYQHQKYILKLIKSVKNEAINITNELFTTPNSLIITIYDFLNDTTEIIYPKSKRKVEY